MGFSKEMFMDYHALESFEKRNDTHQNYRLDSFKKYESWGREEKEYKDGKALFEMKLAKGKEELMLGKIDIVSMQEEIKEEYDYYEVGYPSERENMKWTCIKKCKDRKEADKVFKKLYPQFRKDPAPVLHIRPCFVA